MSSPELNPGVDHLSPDVLAAWTDGTLSAREQSAAEEHAADCAHCQAMLAAMARTAPPEPPRVWWSWGSVRWLVPVAAAMTVVAVWIGTNRERSPVPQRADTIVGLTKSNREMAAPAAPRAQSEATVTDNAGDPEAKSEAAKKRALLDEKSGRRESTQSRAAGDVAAGESRLDAIAPKPAAEPIAPPALAAPPAADARAPQALGGVAQSALPPSAPAPSAPVPSPPEPLLPLQEKVTVTTAAPTAKTPAREAGAVAREAASVARARPVEVVSPERAYRWRAETPGSILYSMDSGTSWHLSSSGTTVPLQAGSAPSRSVCWLVGQGGTVLLTIDGQNWQVRPFPERVDLTDVRASDARNATVTTANRRRFATSDGGATWSPLQEN